MTLAAALRKAMGLRLRAHQRAFRSPFGNLRGQPQARAFSPLRKDTPEGCRGERKAPARAMGAELFCHSGDKGALECQISWIS